MLINGKKELYGLQIVDASNGMIRRGSVYVTLERMPDKGPRRIAAGAGDPNRSGIPRRLYRATGAGVRAYKAWTARRN